MDTELEVREWSSKKVYLLYKNTSDFNGGEVTWLDRVNWDLLQVPREQRNQLYRSMLGGSFTNGDFDTITPKAPEPREPAAPSTQTGSPSQ